MLYLMYSINMIISSHTSTSQFASFSHGHGASTQFQRSVVLDWLGRIGPYFSTYIFSAFRFISRCFRYCSIARLQFGCVSRYNCNSYSVKSHCCKPATAIPVHACRSPPGQNGLYSCGKIVPFGNPSSAEKSYPTADMAHTPYQSAFPPAAVSACQSVPAAAVCLQINGSDPMPFLAGTPIPFPDDSIASNTLTFSMVQKRFCFPSNRFLLQHMPRIPKT